MATAYMPAGAGTGFGWVHLYTPTWQRYASDFLLLCSRNSGKSFSETGIAAKPVTIAAATKKVKRQIACV